jgi:all-trans-retinol dehydrogenase (NAD+)
MCRTFIETMIARKTGHIVAISSMLGLDGHPYAVTYCATKFGVRGLMASLYQELKMLNLHKSIGTTCIFPWFINTRQDLEDNVTSRSA